MGNIKDYYVMPHPPILIPEVGRGEETKIKKTSEACNKVAEEIATTKPDTIIIVTPHGPLFRDAISLSVGENIKGNLGKFSAPQVELNLEVNISLTEQIIKYSEEEKISTAKITESSALKYGVTYELDHGTIIPLYFINKKYSNYKVVHITYGMLPKTLLYNFGMCIKKAVEESNTNAVLIASGDLSHRLTKDGPYEYSPYGEIFDTEIIRLLERGNMNGIFNMDSNTVEKAGECGLRSFYIMLGAMNKYNFKGNLLSYEGTFGVGYCVMNFSIQERNKDSIAEPYIRLARESLSYYLNHGDYLDVPNYATDEMKKYKRGVFVSLKKQGRLRGCIGTILPTTENIAEEIIRNAVAAGQHDPRFKSVTQDELNELDFSVDVLTQPQKTSREELNPKKYGVIVTHGYKSGLLLPDLEGVDTVQQQLDIALQKAHIYPGEDYAIEKFQVIRYR